LRKSTPVLYNDNVFPLSFMDQQDIQKKCEALLQELEVPSFVVFGWKKNDKEFGVVSSQHQMPPNAAIKGMSWALNDFISKNL
jgi:hypothetical protein